MYIETWSHFVNKKHLIDEAVKLAVAFFEYGKIRSDEHRHSSAIGKHFHDKHSSTPKDLTTNFTILKKCNSIFSLLLVLCLFQTFTLFTSADRSETADYNNLPIMFQID